MDQKPFHLKSLFLLIGLIVLAVLVVIILQQQQQLRNLKNTNETQSNKNTAEVKAEDQTQAPASGERQLITTPYSQLTGNCEIKANTDAPSTTETFSDKTLGFSIELPYNPNWGTDKYKLNPYEYDTDHKALLYGPIGAGEGCGWRRQSIAVNPPQTDAEAIADIKKNFGSDISFGPEVVTVDGLKMVRYTSGGLCTYQGIVVLGKRHAYGFGTCSDDRNAAYKKFNDMIATLKSI